MVKLAPYKLLFINKDGLIDPNEASNAIGINVNTVKKYLRMLVKEGFIVQEMDKYKLTDKGRKLVNSVKNVMENSGKTSYVITDPNTGTPIPLTIKDYRQLYAVIKYKLAPEDVIWEHVKRGYFINWFRDALKDEYIVSKITSGEISDLNKLLEYIEEIINLIDELSVEEK